MFYRRFDSVQEQGTYYQRIVFDRSTGEAREETIDLVYPTRNISATVFSSEGESTKQEMQVFYQGAIRRFRLDNFKANVALIKQAIAFNNFAAE